MLTYFVIKFETFDTDAMVDALEAFDRNGVIVTFTYSGLINIVQCPPSIPLRSQYRYFTPHTWSANRWIKWNILYAKMTWIMLNVFLRQRTRRCFIAAGDVFSWIAQIFKFLGRIEQTITTVEDWSGPDPNDTVYLRLNKLKIRLNDFLLTHMDTTVMVFPKEIFDVRNAYWKGKTLKNSILVDHQWAWFLEKKVGPVPRLRRNICYLGTCRKNFGIETLFTLMPKLNREHGFRLKMMGPEDELYQYYKSLCAEMNVSQYVEWMGYVDSKNLCEALKDCFCGVNFQEREVNNSRYAIGGRIVHFLQNLLVPVVSPYSGRMADLIEERKLGVVCLADASAMEQGLLAAYHSYSTYVKNIDDFLVHNPYKLTVSNLLRLEPEHRL